MAKDRDYVRAEDMETDDLLDDLRAIMRKDKGDAGAMFRELDKRMSDAKEDPPADWDHADPEDDGDEDGDE